METTHSSSEVAKRPLILRPESIQSAPTTATYLERDELPVQARPFHEVTRNAHPGGGGGDVFIEIL